MACRHQPPVRWRCWTVCRRCRAVCRRCWAVRWRCRTVRWRRRAVTGRRWAAEQHMAECTDAACVTNATDASTARQGWSACAQGFRNEIAGMRHTTECGAKSQRLAGDRNMNSRVSAKQIENRQEHQRFRMGRLLTDTILQSTSLQQTQSMLLTLATSGCTPATGKHTDTSQLAK
jgi:hypothetical protein